MQKFFTILCILSVSAFWGCGKPAEKPAGVTPPPKSVDKDSTPAPGYVEPMIPKKDDPATIAKPATPAVTEPVEPAEPVKPEPVEPEPAAPAKPEPVEPEPAAPVKPEPVEPEPAAPVKPEPVEPEPAAPVKPEPVAPVKPEPVKPEPAEPEPKTSAEVVPLPPAADLTAQIDDYVDKIGKALEDLDGSTKYSEDSAAVVRDVNGLVLVAKAVYLTAEDSQYKKSALNIIAAAKKLEVAGSFEAGQKAYDALKESLDGKGDAAEEPDWSKKTANLKPVMKAVPNLNSAVKRASDKETKLEKTLDGKKKMQFFGNLAALAAIAQGSIANVHDTAKPDAAADWEKESKQLRDSAIAANKAAHEYAAGKADYAAFVKAFDAMNKSCHACHDIFSPEANKTAE